ncbi:MAG: desulfoferrodoxin family protein [Oscillospiraceae bacterium]
MAKQKFFVCKHCGNLVAVIEDAKVPMVCCGEKMTELVPGSVDASVEKHVPQVTVDGKKVTVEVGSVEHPMVPEHFIKWIFIQTEKGAQIKYLSPEQSPKAVFELADDTVVTAYAFCNLHGLWSKDI